VLLHERADGFEVVIGQHEGVLRVVGRHAEAVRLAERRRAGAGLHEHAVRMAVVAALELEDVVALREAPRHPQGAHAGFGAAGHQAELLERRDRGRQELGHFDFGDRGGSVRGALPGRFDHGLQDFRRGVTQDHRAPGAHVINVVLAVDVADAGTLRRRHEEGGAADRPEGADGGIHAAGNDGLGALECRFAAGNAVLPHVLGSVGRNGSLSTGV
jgi:hypothetical protein